MNTTLPHLLLNTKSSSQPNGSVRSVHISKSFDLPDSRLLRLDPIDLLATIKETDDELIIVLRGTAQEHLICEICTKDTILNVPFTIEKSLKYNSQDELDIFPWVYEELMLQLPMNIRCTDDCKGLCQQCGKNRNFETCDCPTL